MANADTASTATTASRLPTTTVQSLLGEARGLVEPAYRAAVTRIAPPMRLIAGYNAGWWDEQRKPSVNPGKAVRPALVLAAARAMGAREPHACVPEAVAVEMVHDFSLLHDDFMDGDLRRRNRATAWSVFGANAAILAGNALLALATHELTDRPSRGVLSRTLLDLCWGQSADLQLEASSAVSLDECLAMSEHKTAALISCACEMGALTAGASLSQRRALAAFGRHVGMAFQLRDDVLGIWGDPAVTGKPIYSDLINRKKSPPIVAALESSSPDGRELRELYAANTNAPDALRRMAQLMESGGARAWAEHRMSYEVSAAYDCLSEVASREATHHLRLIAALVTQRPR